MIFPKRGSIHLIALTIILFTLYPHTVLWNRDPIKARILYTNHLFATKLLTWGLETKQYFCTYLLYLFPMKGKQQTRKGSNPLGGRTFLSSQIKILAKNTLNLLKNHIMLGEDFNVYPCYAHLYLRRKSICL